MSKEAELERQLSELRKAKEAVLSKIDECMRLPDSRKATMWNEIVPLLKSAIEKRILGAVWDGRSISEVVLDKALKALLGPDAQSLLEKL